MILGSCVYALPGGMPLDFGRTQASEPAVCQITFLLSCTTLPMHDWNRMFQDMSNALFLNKECKTVDINKPNFHEIYEHMKILQD